MTVSDFVAQAYLKGTGKVSSLTASDANWIKLLALGNYYTQTWAKEAGVDWRSLYNTAISSGTISATDTFPLDSSIYKVSQNEDDPVRVVWASDPTKYTDYTIVPSDELKRYTGGNVCAIVGNSLKFPSAFTASSSEFGGTINVPAYTLPAPLVDASDTIAVDIPEWLSVRCAAEYVRNDLVRQNQYSNLIAEANELMQKMVENNVPQHTTLSLHRVATGRTW